MKRAVDEEMETLCVEHDEQLKRFILKHVHNTDLVDDIAQATYLEALKSWQHFRGQAKRKTWLFGIAYNLVRNQNRSSYKQPSHIPLDHLTTQLVHKRDGLQGEIDSMRVLQLCDIEIRRMPTDMKNVLQLVVFDGLSYEDAASELGVALGTVRSRLSRARLWLKNHLSHVFII